MNVKVEGYKDHEVKYKMKRNSRYFTHYTSTMTHRMLVDFPPWGSHGSEDTNTHIKHGVNVDLLGQIKPRCRVHYMEKCCVSPLLYLTCLYFPPERNSLFAWNPRKVMWIIKHAHHSGRRGSCRTRLPRLPHGPSCWSHLPWLGLAWPHSHALSLGWGLLLIPAHCRSAGLPGPRRRRLSLLLELGPLSCGPVHLRTLTTLSSWSCRASGGALSTARAAARPGGACVSKWSKTDLPTSSQMQHQLRLRRVKVNRHQWYNVHWRYINFRGSFAIS